jgi:hypothetical protein
MLQATPPDAELILSCARTRMDARSAARCVALARGPLDWDRLIGTAAPHGVVPLLQMHLGALCSDAVPAEALGRMRAHCRRTQARALAQAGDLLEIVRRFAEAGVPVLPYKGPTLAVALYGNLALRESGDLDVLVRWPDVAHAQALLADLGYRPDPCLAGAPATILASLSEHRLVRADGEVAELHWAVTPRFFSCPLDLEAFWSRSRPVALGGTPVRTLATEDLILVLCVHGTWHRWERLAWICDIAEILRRFEAIDLEGVLTRARGIGAARMLLLGLHLAADLLQAPLPERARRAALADPAVARLAARVRSRLFHHFPGGPSGGWGDHLFHLGARERFLDRVRYCGRAAFTANHADWGLVRLPDRLRPLYRLVRPLRLAGKHARRLVTRAGAKVS